MTDSTNTSGAPTNGGNSFNQTGSVVKSIPARKVAVLKLAMDGAEKRILRLKTELLECRAIIRRKYDERPDAKGKSTTQVQLNPAQIQGYRLKRTQIEEQLATATGDYLQSKRAYRKAVVQNIQVGRKSVKMVREENRVRRDAKALLRKTKVILQKHAENGGEEEIAELTAYALNDDVKGFRLAFDDRLERFDPLHFVTISGVSSVKTEIIHALMDELAEGKQKNIPQGLTEAVSSTEGGAQ